jgi:hypothetical protein
VVALFVLEIATLNPRESQEDNSQVGIGVGLERLNGCDAPQPEVGSLSVGVWQEGEKKVIK